MIFVLYQWNDTEEAGPEVYVSSINMRYDREKRQRVLYCDFLEEMAEGRSQRVKEDLFSISAESGEWNEINPLPRPHLKNEIDQLKIELDWGLKQVNGDIHMIKEWIIGKLHPIGFRQEFRITIASENTNLDNVWWVVRYQRQFGGKSPALLFPLFVTRYIKDDGCDCDEMFGGPGIAQDLYMQEDGYVNEEEISEAIVQDIRRFTDNPLDVLVEYKFR